MAAPQCVADRYELGALLGRGGMGDVYDGWDRRLERQVAVKLLNSDLAAHADVRTRFEAEARAAAMLVSPKVVAVYDTGEHNGIPFIVMERLPGRTLADELAGGPMPQARVRALMLDMLEALAAAHAEGIVHRDIKPSNVLLTQAGGAKIADFGIAKSSTAPNLTQTGSIVGTAAYLSPERVMGQPAGPGSDLYSVGIVGFEALAGSTPFDADTPLGLIRAITEDPIPSLKDLVPKVDDDLAAAIEKATRREPGDRFESARAMIDALRPAGASMPSARTRPLPTAPTEPTIVEPAGRRKRWLALAALALAVMLVARFGFGRSFTEPDGPALGSSPIQSPSSSAGSLAAGPGTDVPISGVSSVEFLGPGTLLIDQTGPESLKIDAPQALLSSIITQASNGKLTIGSRGGPAQLSQVTYRLVVKRLDSLQVSGAGSVRAGNISGSALRVTVIGSASTAAEGVLDQLLLSLSGAGSFDGTNLQASQATVEVSGSGNATVAVSKTLDARLSGSGELHYLGNPSVTKNVSGSGTISKSG